jgi:hypothetical protein
MRLHLRSLTALVLVVGLQTNSFVYASKGPHPDNLRHHIPSQFEAILGYRDSKIGDEPVLDLSDSPSNSHCGEFSGPTESCPLDSDVFLKTSLIELGIHPASSFGSQNNIPPDHGFAFSKYCADCRLGFICDYDSDGLTVGYPPYSGDYFVPGSPVEGWSVQYTTPAGTKRFRNAGLLGLQEISPDKISITSDDVAQSSVWTGHNDEIEMTVTTTVPYGKQTFYVDACVTNKSPFNLIGLHYMRNVDPDQTVNWNSDYTTYNFVKYQPSGFGYPEYVNSEDSTLAVVVARGLPGYEKFVLALGAADSRAFASHGGFQNLDDPAAYYNLDSNWKSFGGSDVELSDIDRMNEADEGIQVVFREDSVAPEEKVCFRTFFGLSVEFEHERPPATLTPTPGPAPGCKDQSNFVTCDVLESLHACDEKVTDPWGAEVRVRDLCPLKCGCQNVGDVCVCDDNEGLKARAREFGIWAPSCQYALWRVKTCDHRFYGSALKQYCTVSCGDQFSGGEGSEGERAAKDFEY